MKISDGRLACMVSAPGYDSLKGPGTSVGPELLQCLVIADDLTGACDAAIPFVIRGYHTAVSIANGKAEPGTAVLSLSTDSRDFEAAEIGRAMDGVASSTPFRSARTLFKKIDSTLRGRVGAEISAAIAVFECDAAVVCPAFPAMRRIVEAGYLSVTGDSDFRPIEVAGRLQSQGLSGCRHVSLCSLLEAIASGVRFVSLDASCDQDLDRIVATCSASSSRILWAGSAGMAAALARSLPLCGGKTVGPPTHAGPVLFCIGSNHAATIAQQTALLSSRRCRHFTCENATAESIASALACGEHVLLRIPRGEVAAARLLELTTAAPAAAILLSGGDTASFVCHSTQAQKIDLAAEVAPGIPWGVIGGGTFAGMPVVTKSGGFGEPDALIRVADYFSCRK